MTELKTFLVALYDALSEAEIEAFAHAQARMAALAEAESLPADLEVPVYHATDMNISLDVGLEVDRTQTGTEVYITQPPPEDESRMTFTVDMFDLIETQDIADIDPEDVIRDLPSPALSHRSHESEETGPPGSRTGELHDEDPDENDEGPPDNSSTSPYGSGGVTDRPSNQPVRSVDAIETSTAEILENSGIETVAELLTSSPEELAATVEDQPDSDDAAALVRDAQAAATSASDPGRPIESIDGIGPAYGQRLRENGIETVTDLPTHSPEAIAAIVSTDDVTVPTQRTRYWIEEAQDMIAESTTGTPRNEGPPES